MPFAEIGRGARLSNVIVDAEVRIPPGLVVGEDPESMPPASAAANAASA